MSNFNARIPLVGLQNRRKNENSVIKTKSSNKITDSHSINFF